MVIRKTIKETKELGNEVFSYKWQKLSTCAKFYNYEFKAHDALEDVKATLFCYKKMMKNKEN